MGSQRFFATKIVFVMTSFALLPACGHKEVRVDTAQDANPALYGAYTSSFGIQTEASLENTYQPIKKKNSVKKKKRTLVNRTQLKSIKKSNATLQTATLKPTQTQAETSQPLTVIDPSELPLSVGAMDNTQNPKPPSSPPFYEGVKANRLAFGLISTFVLGLLTAIVFIVRRRRNRHDLILN